MQKRHGQEIQGSNHVEEEKMSLKSGTNFVSSPLLGVV